MIIAVDTHTHTNISHHAYSTLEENIAAAKRKGMEGIAITNHGPALGDGAHLWHFSSLKNFKNYVYGLRLLRGAEANIMNEEGEIDLDDYSLAPLEIVIASMHTPCFAPKQPPETVTRAWLNTLEHSPKVNIVGHMGDGRYKCDYAAVLKKVKETGRIVEINHHSFDVRKGSDENCREIALICKELKIPVVLSTDAHFSDDVGEVENSWQLLKSIDFPEELILNTSLRKLAEFLNLEV
ncbi:MAG: phosphatase [Oscillospiraceae bacterium]|nr:phosphatase [Oscillospiraceae bacterium]